MFLGFQTPDLTRYWNLKLGFELRDHGDDEVLFFEQKRTVVTLASDALGTTEVDIDCVTIILDKFCCLKQVLGVVCTKLYD